MSSLHDKYYSEINKNYIYNLACKLIKEEYKIDISDEKYFKEIYEKNVNEAFQTTDTDNLVSLNRNLLQLQIDSFKPYIKKNENDNKGKCVLLQASNRILTEMDSIYNFSLNTYTGSYRLKYLLLSKDNNILFSNPLLTVNMNDQEILVKLNSSYKMNNREFLEYIPIDINDFILNEKTSIHIKNSLNNSCEKLAYRSISNIHDDYIEIVNNGYEIGDTIKINNNIFSIQDIKNNNDIFLENIKDYDIKENDKVLNISESPILVLTQI